MSKFINNKSGIFSRLTTGRHMFKSSSLTSFNANMPALTNGDSMFQFSQVASFNADMPALTNGSNMFYYSQVASFNADMPALTNGINMFYGSQLTSFNANLPNATELAYTFYSCSKLKTLNINAPKCYNNYSIAAYSKVEIANITLTSASGSMFIGSSNLRNATVNASNPYNYISNMFQNCSSLEYVNGNVTVAEASYAFEGCSKLRNISFSFENMNGPAANMLKGCTSLNGECVKRIVKSLPKLACNSCPGQAAIHIDFDTSTLPEEEWIDCIIELLSKGWTVATDTSYNGYYY